MDDEGCFWMDSRVELSGAAAKEGGEAGGPRKLCLYIL